MSKLAGIKMLVLDVDGILTDGSLYVGEDGVGLKRFAIVDGAGIKYLLRYGIGVALISGHDFVGVSRRFQRLGVEEIHVGVTNKTEVLRGILARHHLGPGDIAVMGDDLMDLPMMRGAGFAATVPEAHERVLARADHVTRRSGGHGAVREVAEMLLTARGVLDEIIDGEVH